MSRFEKFAAEEDVMRRVEELRADGYADTEITVISKQKLEDAYLKYRDVNFKNSEGTTWDKFISMFSDDDPKDKVLGQFDITDSEKEHFKYALDREEILLLKEHYGVREEGYVQNEIREHHETQQQDAQSLESETAQDERLDAQKEMPRNRQTESKQDRLHMAEDDERFDSLHSSKAASKGAGASRAGGPTYKEEADRAIREDITLDADREPVEQDHDVTLKDTEKDKEYDYEQDGSRREPDDAVDYDSLDKEKDGYKK